MVSMDCLVNGLSTLAQLGSAQDQRPEPKHLLDGCHAGAALIAAQYLAHEHDLDPTVERLLAERADGLARSVHALSRPLPRAAAQPKLLVLIEEGIERCLDAISPDQPLIGHNLPTHGAISGTAALKALRDRPELATPSLVRDLRVALDLCATAYWPYTGTATEPARLPVTQEDGIADYDTEEQMIAGAFEELDVVYANAPTAEGSGPCYLGAAYKGHLITFTHTVCLLEQLGLARLVRKAVALQRRQVKLARMAPPDPAQHRLPQSPYTSLLDSAYWSAAKPDQPHAIKFPWSALSLLQKLPASERSRYEANACWLLTQY